MKSILNEWHTVTPNDDNIKREIYIEEEKNLKDSVFIKLCEKLEAKTKEEWEKYVKESSDLHLFTASLDKKNNIVGFVGVSKEPIKVGKRKIESSWMIAPLIVEQNYRCKNYFIGNYLIKGVLEFCQKTNEDEKIYSPGKITDRTILKKYFGFRQSRATNIGRWRYPGSYSSKKKAYPSIVYDPIQQKNDIVDVLIGNYLKNKYSGFSKNPILQNGIIANTLRERASEKGRVVVVIGAGASVEADLLLADRASEIIKNKILKGGYIDQSVIDDELDSLSSINNLPPDFESKLQALGKYHIIAEAVRKELKDLYKAKFQPTLCYEILAHLFKQRAIDVIINFNFDEILDQSIDDELRKNQYVKILSDGDCPENFNSENSNGESSKNIVIEKPIYIKPHGTFSHPSTMRFTKEEYFKIPSGIKKSIEECLKGNVTILIVGFSMRSIEFNSILKKVVLEHSKNGDTPIRKYYYINKFLDITDTLNTIGLDSSEIKKLNELYKAKEGLPPDGLITVNDESVYGMKFSNVSCLFETIADDIYFKLEKIHEIKDRRYLFPSIERHKIICQIFNNACKKSHNDSNHDYCLNCHNKKCNECEESNCEDDGCKRKNCDSCEQKKVKKIQFCVDNEDAQKHYFYIRCLIELIFSAVRNKGRMSLELIEQDRVGDYYKKYIWKNSESYDSIFELAKRINLEKDDIYYQFSKHYEGDDAIEELLKGLFEVISDKRMSEEQTEKEFYEKIWNNILESDLKNRLTIYLKENLQGPSKEIELYSKEIIPLIYGSGESHYLRSRLELYSTLYHLIEKGKWRKLEIATQDPGWFVNENTINRIIRASKEKTIDMVVSTGNSSPKIINTLNKIDEITISERKWFKHKRFIALFYDEEIEPTDMIYYDQGHYKSFVVPILVTVNGQDNSVIKNIKKELQNFTDIFNHYKEYSTTV